MIETLTSGIIDFTKKLVLRANYELGNYREVLWLVGDGRSGTTWVSDLINHDKRYRQMFEPFHPQLVPAMDFLTPHHYVRPLELNEKVKRIAGDVINGRFTDTRVDARICSLWHHGLLIKDIFANLLCGAVSREFPHIKPVLLIRNPFAVACSKLKTKDWFWLTEPLDLLNQKELVEDYLIPFKDIIQKTSTKKNYLLNQILIWSILHYVPLRQFSPDEIHICFYEDIYTAPEQEIADIMYFAKGKQAAEQVKLQKDYINRPSAVSGPKSTVVLGTSPLCSWKTELDPGLINDGYDILRHFGLADLYDHDNALPIRAVIKKLQDT
jgi:hypothetical protein